MKNMQTFTDNMAIGLSLLCAIHCLALPLVMVLLPSLVASSLNDEAFHLWLVLAVLPISAYGLTMGCKKHQHYRVLIMGGIGLSILAITLSLGHQTLGDTLEKMFTVIGASIVALGHIWNYRLCQRQADCRCP